MNFSQGSWIINSEDCWKVYSPAEQRWNTYHIPVYNSAKVSLQIPMLLIRQNGKLNLEFLWAFFLPSLRQTIHVRILFNKYMLWMHFVQQVYAVHEKKPSLDVSTCYNIVADSF